MDVNIQSQLQFLNLDDVDVNVAEYLHSVLFPNVRSANVELPPWSDTEEQPVQEWSQQPQYGEAIEAAPFYSNGQPNELVDTGGGEIYPMSMPVATTMQQMYHAPVVQPIPSMTYVSSMPHPPYHPGLAQPPQVPTYQGGPQQIYPPHMPHNTSRPRGSKPSPKRGGGTIREGSAPPYNPPGPGYHPAHPSYPPPIHHVPFPCIPTTLSPHFPTAQHATGPPLYIAPPLSMYHQPIYHNYGPVFSPLAQQPPEEMKPMEFGEKVEPPHQAAPVNVYIPAQVGLPQSQMNEPGTAHSPAAPKDDVHHLSQQQIQQQQQSILPLPQQQSIPLHHPHEPPAPEQIEAPKPPEVASSPPAPATGQSPPDKHPPPPVKSHPPKDAIITTAPPSLPPVKRKPVDEPPPPAAPVPTPEPAPAPVKMSYAGLFKGGSTPAELSERRAFKPPQNAVALSAPPTSSPKLPSTSHPDSHKEDTVNPALRHLGDKLTNYKLEHKAIILTPRGLTNPSNYCYINATLQALIACPAFYNLIKLIANVKSASSMAHQKESSIPIIDSMVQFIREFQQAPPSRFQRKEKVLARKDSTDANSLDMMTGPPFEPSFIYKMLRKIRSEDSFHEEGRQEDAEEFLSLLLNGLNDEMLELQKLVADTNAPVVNGEVTANGGDSHDDETAWKEVTTKGSRLTRRAVLERTPLSDIFRGQLRSRVLRATSEESTDSVQPFFTLQLDIESSETVVEALEKLVEGVTIDGDSNSDLIRQQQTLDELPCVLILHLKCFHYRQHAVSKVMKALQFPIDLRLDPRLLSTKNKTNVRARQYKLFAVVYHDGQEATKGHYLADVFHLGPSGWIRYDDAAVKLVKEEQVLDPKPPRIPYLLYYRRADTIGSQRNT